MIQKILVTGATGQQGGAAIRELLGFKYDVRALVRDIHAPQAKQLAAQDVELFEGDLDDTSSIRAALRDVDAVLMVLPSTWEMDADTDSKEADMGIAIIDLMKGANIEYVIYSSVMLADRHASFRPRFKHTIEKYLFESGLNATVLRPATFMENLLMPSSGIAREGKYYNFMPQGIKIPYITTLDVGIFAAMVFNNYEQYVGKTIDLVGDLLTEVDVVKKLEKTLGRKIELVNLSRETLVAQNPIFGQLVDLFNTKEFEYLDFTELRRINPSLRSFSDWLVELGAEKLKNS